LRLLLDTHALLWSVLADPHLSGTARAALADPGAEILISAVSIFEITLKHRLGKLQQAGPFARHHDRMLADLDWLPLPVSMEHAALAGSLDIPHKDPFDRLLIAQARVERVPIVSHETLFDAFGVERIW
jgi:PIN domain nuclease of toxin-antitoxin system